MFSKLVLASSVFLTAEAIKVRHHNQLRAKKVEETCGFNIQRWASPSETGDFKKFSGGKTLYKDPDFPADESSLFWRGHLRSAAMAQVYIDEVTSWARPSDLVEGGKPSLWGSKGVKPSGTSQGRLMDCWMLASASALAEFPERIKKIFTNTEYDSAGIFQVTFYAKGQPVTITVDDQIPISEGMDPGYTNFGVKIPENARMSVNGAWWQVIIEKAYAKFNVNYAQLSGGFPGIAMRELTGMPVINFDALEQTGPEFFAVVSEADKRNWAMAVGCQMEHASLVTGHAYTILGVASLAGGPDLVKLRNPWAKEEYTGPFNDNSDDWTPAWKKQVGLVAGDDGIFYIPVADFKKAMTQYSVVMYEDNWFVESQGLKMEGQRYKAKFTSPVDQEAVITVDYQNPRQIEAGCPIADLWYNFYIDNGAPNDVSSQIGTGSVRMNLVAGKAYDFMMINWGDTTVVGDLWLYTYGSKAAIKWS